MQIFIEQQNNRHLKFKQEAMFSGLHSQNQALEEIEKKSIAARNAFQIPKHVLVFHHSQTNLSPLFPAAAEASSSRLILMVT